VPYLFCDFSRRIGLLSKISPGVEHSRGFIGYRRNSIGIDEKNQNELPSGSEVPEFGAGDSSDDLRQIA
jgi:hypothetical protein